MALYVRESGPATAPTILFLHGGGASGWTWQPQMAALADYHCLAPDLPEQGQSAAAGPFTIRAAAAQVAGLIRARAHGGRADVVGLSLGAQTAVQLLSTAPVLVDHALVSGTLVRPLPGAGLINLLAWLYMPFRNNPLLIRANMRSYGIPARYYRQFAADTRRLRAASFTHITTENMRFRLPPGLDRVAVPTLVVVGEKEPKLIHQSARDLVAALRRAQGMVARGVGHNWSFEAPDRFTAMVRAWITDAPLPPGLVPFA
jgi:pimeloyl-ACP methyl ester carboxylesterase